MRPTSGATRIARLGGLALTLAMLAACNKDPPPKPIQDEPKKTTPVPSDMVFNDFIPQGGPGGGLAVRMDGGLEGGLAAAGDGGGGGGDPAADPAAKVHLVEPGAEPRAARKYAFVANRAEKRTVVIRQSQSVQGKTQEMPGVSFTVDLTPKTVTPKGAKLELKVVKVELADMDKLPPQIQQQAQKELGPFAGLTAQFEIGAHGELGELSMSGNEKMQKQGAEEILQALSQLVEIVVAPLPEAPIGAGAKWELDESGAEGGVKQTGKRSLELKELSSDGVATIVTTVERKVGKRPVPDPRMAGATMEVDGKGTYTYTQRFDRVASKVVGEMTQVIKIDAPGGAKGEKRSVTQEAKMKHTLDTPGGK